MKSAMLRIQFLVMRVFGVNRLQHALGTHSDTIRADLKTQLDGNSMLAERLENLQNSIRELSNQLSEQGRASHERGETDQRSLNSIIQQLSEQGRASHERGETDQRTLSSIIQKIDEFRAFSRNGGEFSLTLGGLQAEISALRTDFARELERLSDDFLDEHRKTISEMAVKK